MTKETMETIMTHIEIENAVPPPPKTGAAIKRYPWASMKAGDSFLLPCTYRELASTRSKVVYAARGNGVKIQTRTEKDGLRVWLMG